MECFVSSFLYMRELNTISILARFLLAVICGGIIGTERGKKLRAAGLRTHLLVCIGSASVMMLSQYISLYMDPNVDLTRLGAQVISGIGFLGVGTIVVTGQNQIKGLTTAAGLWASACMGLAIGIGFYEGAVIMCLFLYIVLEVVNILDMRFLKTYNNLNLYIELSTDAYFSSVLSLTKSDGWKTDELKQLTTGNHCNAMMISLSHKDPKHSHCALIDKIRQTPGIIFVEIV